MASSLLALLDDVATILDDVAAMTKIATKKTAGVLGDDLALNAKQVTGVSANREIPVVWAVAKGSFRNKLILVPAALAISVVLPWAITPLLMLGGLFLCFEGVEKLVHAWLHPAESAENKAALHTALADGSVDLVAFEQDKIKGAVRTDFILSAEIIVISLGTVAAASFGAKLAVLCAISLIMTIGVYGLVAGIVKLDDAGVWLSAQASAAARGLGSAILFIAPWLMKTLSIVGTAAMFMVGGGILTHGFHWLSERIQATAARVAEIPGLGNFGSTLTAVALDALVGILAGGVVVALVTLVTRLRGKRSTNSARGHEMGQNSHQDTDQAH